MRAEDLVQVFLLGAVVFALTGFPKAAVWAYNPK
jgi:hypothetical protein